MHIEEGIRPLVNAIGGLGFASTVYSCEGHFDGERNELFLPTAYVTFSVSDLEKFGRLYGRLRALDGSFPPAGIKLTYDCILGRYTLSIWPGEFHRNPSEKRSAVDSAIELLADEIASYAETHAERDLNGGCIGRSEEYPCGVTPPPCALVIPWKTPICPFNKTT